MTLSPSSFIIARDEISLIRAAKCPCFTPKEIWQVSIRSFWQPSWLILIIPWLFVNFLDCNHANYSNIPRENPQHQAVVKEYVVLFHPGLPMKQRLHFCYLWLYARDTSGRGHWIFALLNSSDSRIHSTLRMAFYLTWRGFEQDGFMTWLNYINNY